MEVTVGRRLAMLDVLEGDQEWWVDGGCAESGERESPRRVGDDAPRDAVGVEPDEEFPAADRRLYSCRAVCTPGLAGHSPCSGGFPG